jgi:hypothetical protein
MSQLGVLPWIRRLWSVIDLSRTRHRSRELFVIRNHRKIVAVPGAELLQEFWFSLVRIGDLSSMK